SSTPRTTTTRCAPSRAARRRTGGSARARTSTCSRSTSRASRGWAATRPEAHERVSTVASRAFCSGRGPRGACRLRHGPLELLQALDERDGIALGAAASEAARGLFCLSRDADDALEAQQPGLSREGVQVVGDAVGAVVAPVDGALERLA